MPAKRKRSIRSSVRKKSGGQKQPAPVPRALCRQIAWLAVSYARQYMQMRNWKGAQELKPIWRSNTVGIAIPPSLSYLNFQNRGTRPFIPWTLEGKVIPIPKGQFRTAVGVGAPGWIHDWRPGMYYHQIWREQKWRNPGIKATWFIDRAIRQALERYKKELSKYAKGREWIKNGI